MCFGPLLPWRYRWGSQLPCPRTPECPRSTHTGSGLLLLSQLPLTPRMLFWPHRLSSLFLFATWLQNAPVLQQAHSHPHLHSHTCLSSPEECHLLGGGVGWRGQELDTNG